LRAQYDHASSTHEKENASPVRLRAKSGLQAKPERSAKVRAETRDLANFAQCLNQ
jgi:hypothetical protein